MNVLLFVIGIILGTIATVAIELFIIWLLIFHEDKRDMQATDYDEIDN